MMLGIWPYVQRVIGDAVVVVEKKSEEEAYFFHACRIGRCARVFGLG
jgi:hypothetical protein